MLYHVSGEVSPGGPSLKRYNVFHFENTDVIRGVDIYIVYPISRVLYRGRSRFQEIVVADSPVGKMLILDGVMQLTARDEATYHRALVLPAMPRRCGRVLILGGGDGGAAREVKRAAPQARVTVVDIDPEVTRVVEEYMPEVPAGVFSMEGVELVNADAYEYVMSTSERFDLILGDLTDIRAEWEAGSQVNRLYSEEFLRALRERLRPGGRVVYHVAGLMTGANYLGLFWRTCSRVFSHTVGYGVYIPTFMDIWCFVAMGEELIELGGDVRVARLRMCGEQHEHSPMCFIG